MPIPDGTSVRVSFKAGVIWLGQLFTGRLGSGLALGAAGCQGVALVEQEWLFASLGHDHSQIVADPRNSEVTLLFLMANLGLSLVIAGAGALAAGRFLGGASIGTAVLLLSQLLLNLDNLAWTVVGDRWLRTLLGLANPAAASQSFPPEGVTQLGIVFALDALEVFGAALLGTVLWQWRQRSRPLAVCLFCMAGWAGIDLAATVFAPDSLDAVSEWLFPLLAFGQCLAAAWLFGGMARGDRRGRRDRRAATRRADKGRAPVSIRFTPASALLRAA